MLKVMVLCKTALELLCDCYTNTSNLRTSRRRGGGLDDLWTAVDRRGGGGGVRNVRNFVDVINGCPLVLINYRALPSNSLSMS